MIILKLSISRLSFLSLILPPPNISWNTFKQLSLNINRPTVTKFTCIMHVFYHKIDSILQ